MQNEIDLASILPCNPAFDTPLPFLLSLKEKHIQKSISTITTFLPVRFEKSEEQNRQKY
jgi:hypothetical protein